MVAICFALHRGKREERGRAESVCFTLFEVGGVFLGAWRTEGKKWTYIYIVKSALFVECQRVMKITLFRGHPRGGGVAASGQ